MIGTDKVNSIGSRNSTKLVKNVIQTTLDCLKINSEIELPYTPIERSNAKTINQNNQLYGDRCWRFRTFFRRRKRQIFWRWIVSLSSSPFHRKTYWTLHGVNNRDVSHSLAFDLLPASCISFIVSINVHRSQKWFVFAKKTEYGILTGCPFTPSLSSPRVYESLVGVAFCIL